MTTWLVRGCRAVFAVLAALALGWQAHRVVEQSRGLDNFFSYFTIESNILGVLVLAWGAFGRVPDQVRGAVVVYLAITGVVYALLLADLPGQHIQPWVNSVVHQVMPVVVVLDWLLAPPRQPLPQVWWSWLVFPALFLVYTLVRGVFAHWYPYPFLDPNPGGYGHVAIAAVGIAAGFVLATLAVRWVGVAIGRRA